MSGSKSSLGRADSETNAMLNELQAILASRNIHMSHNELLKWAVMFARARLLEFLRFINGEEEDGLLRFVRKVVKGGPESNSVEEHDLVI